MDDSGTLWFAPTVPGRVYARPDLRVPVPVGDRCTHCVETFVEGDAGFVTNGGLVPFHQNCLLRLTVGSLGHVMGWCSCYGGDGTAELDPESMTKRQAANAAADAWRKKQGHELK